MNEMEIREIIRDELLKAEVVFSFEPIKQGKDEGLVKLIARLSLPEKLHQSTLRASNNNNGEE